MFLSCVVAGSGAFCESGAAVPESGQTYGLIAYNMQYSRGVPMTTMSMNS